MKNDALLLSFMMRMGDEKTLTSEEIKYELNQNVSDCEVAIYRKVVKMLSSSCTYEELLEDEKGYVKRKTKEDLNIRINKLKRRDKNE